jgi:hypothetical protein
VLLCGALALIGITAALSNSARGMTVQTWKSDSALVFMHRAACMVAPENTVPALEEAVRQGADGVEIDIRRTRDGVLVLYHDDWVLRQRGPAGKIEDMTLAETQKLDVGERFGPKWRGTRLPLFEDTLRFAVANDLSLYLDVKTPGIYDEVMRAVKKHDCLRLVHATGGQVPSDHYRLPIPWISGWNYTESGEEDPERMREVIARAPSGVYGIMCDDARSIVRALGRSTLRRPFSPFVSTMRHRLRVLPRGTGGAWSLDDLRSGETKRRTDACVALSLKPEPAARDLLLSLAESDPDYTVRQEACWALGSLRDDRAAPALLRVAQTRFDPKTAGETGFRDTFLKIAAACALARLDSRAGREALGKLLTSRAEFDRAAAAVGLAAFGSEKDLDVLQTLVTAGPENDGLIASIVTGYAGRFGEKAVRLYLTALARADTAKGAVFGLASLGQKVLPTLQKAFDDPNTSPEVRKRIGHAIFWSRSDQGTSVSNYKRRDELKAQMEVTELDP